MLFNSLDFGLAAALFYMMYALAGDRHPITFTTLFSLFFYAYWDVRYLPLLIFSAAVDFFCARRIDGEISEWKRRLWLWLAVVLNLSILGFFKYWNFAADIIEDLSGNQLAIHSFLLPIGLSFYTLQTLGYTIDVYRRKVTPETSFGIYLFYVSFFPQLVAGPIERADRLLPQLKTISKFKLKNFLSGFLLILWGLFVKTSVADNMAIFIGQSLHASGAGYLYWPICLGTTFQIYCDFYGYTLIARGLAKGLGIRLSENFRQPFFAKTLTYFWQSWHITLTKWIIDYVHIPLVRRFQAEPTRSFIAIGVMCLIGLWHGASWNFIIFGLFHGVVLRLWVPIGRLLKGIPAQPWARELFSRLCLLIVLSLSAPLFMITSLSQCLEILQGMLSTQSGVNTLMATGGKIYFLLGSFLGCFVLANDLLIRSESRWHIEHVSETSVLLSVIYSIGLIALITLCGYPGGSEFVYFQF